MTVVPIWLKLSIWAFTVIGFYGFGAMTTYGAMNVKRLNAMMGFDFEYLRKTGRLKRRWITRHFTDGTFTKPAKIKNHVIMTERLGIKKRSDLIVKDDLLQVDKRNLIIGLSHLKSMIGLEDESLKKKYLKGKDDLIRANIELYRLEQNYEDLIHKHNELVKATNKVVPQPFSPKSKA